MKKISDVQTQYNVCPSDDEKFNKILKNNASKAEKELKKLGFIERSIKLIKLVDDKKLYDLKRQREWKNNYVLASVNQFKETIYEKDEIYHFNSEIFKNCFT